MSEQNVGITFSPEHSRNIKRFSPGYDSLEYNIIRVPFQASAGFTPYDFILGQSEYGNFTFSDASSIDYIQQTADVALIPFIFRNMTCAIDYWRASATTVPDLSGAKIPCLFDQWEIDFKAGLQNEELPLLKEDGDEAGTITDALETLNWKDEGLGTDPFHFTKFRTKFHSAGLAYRKKWPKGTAQLAQAAKKVTGFDHIVRMVMCRVMLELGFEKILNQAQTAGFISKCGINIAGYQTKFTEFGTDNGFEPIINKICETGRQNKIGSALDSSAFEVFLYSALDMDLLDNANLVKLLFGYKQEYLVPKWSLNEARSHWGAGQYTHGGQKRNFINLQIGAVNTSSGDYDYHGLLDLAPGIEDCLHITLMREWDQIPILEIINNMVVEQASYTYKEVAPLFTDMFTSYNYPKHMNGYADPDTYVGIRPMMKFSEKTDYLHGNYADYTKCVVNDPHTMHTTGTVKTGLANYANNLEAAVAVGKLLDYDHIYNFPNGMDLARLRHILYWENYFSLTSTSEWDDDRFMFHRMQFNDFIKSENKESINIVFVNDTNVKLNVECVLDPTDYAANPFVAMKYIHGFETATVTPAKLAIDSRPLGEEDSVSIHIGQRDVRLAIAELHYATATSSIPASPQTTGMEVEQAPVDAVPTPLVEDEENDE